MDDEPPGVPNCRCVLIVAWDWRVELLSTMDIVFGNTDPYIPEFSIYDEVDDG